MIFRIRINELDKIKTIIDKYYKNFNINSKQFKKINCNFVYINFENAVEIINILYDIIVSCNYFYLYDDDLYIYTK